MATSKEYLTFMLDQLSLLEGVTFRGMMGEYILYLHGRIFAYLCDDRLLVKPVPAAVALLPDAVPEPPYPGAKPMLPVEQVDDREFLKALAEAMYSQLPPPNKQKGRA